MVFFALIIAALVMYRIQSELYSERIFSRLTYRAYFALEETIEGETMYMYEEIANLGALPIPNAKVNTQLPEGLRFVIFDKKNGERQLTDSVQSVFVLRGNAVIRRKWTIKCEKRGTYRPKGAVMIVNDLFGTNACSESLELADFDDKRNTVLRVLPKISSLPECDVDNEYMLGDKVVLRGLLSDPLEINGIREYRDGDPMNSLNWSATAAHDMLLVNSESFTRERRYNVILNLCSRDYERDPHIPVSVSECENSIRVCAALLDRAAEGQPSVRLIVNTLSDISRACELAEASAYKTLNKCEENTNDAVKNKDFNAEAELEGQLFVSRAFSGKTETVDALEVLAELPLYYTMPLERMLEAIADGKLGGVEEGSFVVVTPYVNERVLRFYDVMKAKGRGVAFYLSSSWQHTQAERETNAEIINFMPF